MKTKRKVKKQTYPKPTGKPVLTKAEELLQEGCMVKIRRDHPKKKKGWKKDTIHEIQKPPKGYTNSLMGVFILNKKKEVDFLHFPYMQSIGMRKLDKNKKKKSK